MATTREEITDWLARAKQEKATHMIVVCDTFDYEDYPVFVKQGQNIHEVFANYNNKNMQRVMEVYSLTGKHSITEQLNENRAFHFD